MSEQVLVLAPSIGHGGGIERYVASVVAALDDLGVPAKRLNLHDPSRSTSSRFRFVCGALATILRERPRALFVMHPHFFPIGSLAHRLLRRQWVGFAYGAEVFGEAKARRAAQGSASASVVVTISNYTAAALAQAGIGADRIELVRPVLSREWWHMSDRVRREEADTPTIVTITRLDSSETSAKGVDELIRLIVALRHDGQSVRLQVIGGGSLLAKYRDLADRGGVGDLVEFTGRVDDNELLRRLAAAWLFALPSRVDKEAEGGEGFGIVYVEAASVGVPVLGSSDGGAAEAMADGIGGYLLDPRDSDALLERTRQLIQQHDLRVSLGRAGREWARSNFNPERMRDSISAVLARL